MKNLEVHAESHLERAGFAVLQELERRIKLLLNNFICHILSSLGNLLRNYLSFGVFCCSQNMLIFCPALSLSHVGKKCMSFQYQLEVSILLHICTCVFLVSICLTLILFSTENIEVQFNVTSFYEIVTLSVHLVMLVYFTFCV